MLTHRRRTKKLNHGHVIQFTDREEENDHYGPHVWVLKTTLPDITFAVVEFCSEYYDIDYDIAEAHVNPPRIVDSAGAWDDHQFVSDLWQALEPVGFRTNDGAVVLDAMQVKLEYFYDKLDS